MEDWLSFIDKIHKHLEELEKRDVDFPLFRGHNDVSWKLQPSLYRVFTPCELKTLEINLYFDFKTNSGTLYQGELNSWEILFEMRHAGIPTRMLDWTENFASALFFALRNVDWSNNEKNFKPCIWILNPFELNKKYTNEGGIYSFDKLDFSYDELLDHKGILHHSKRTRYGPITGPIAILIPRARQRGLVQKSVFSLHDISHKPIEDMHNSCVKRFDIPTHLIDKAKEFLLLTGTNEYSLFPDLDGLGRYLNEKFEIRW